MLFGPTAAGKTALVGDVFYPDFEVINADSEQVYRGLEIGTAQPDKKLSERIPHHLVGVRDPKEEFTVGDFVNEADRLVREIRTRGKRPLVAGGTAYYLKHFAVGLPDAPPADRRIRERLKAELTTRGSQALFRELLKVDPKTAAKIGANDAYRLLRALEVYRQSGRPLSAFTPPETLRPQYDFLFLGIAMEKEELFRRIGERVDDMFRCGLLEEFAALRKAGYTENDPGLKGIGYRELFQMEKGILSITEVKELIALHTRQYAKRQATFFKRLPGAEWFRPDDTERITERVKAFLKDRPAG